MPKHFFFDLDKTLTRSRSAMEPEHQELFDKLCAQKDVVVVTGGSLAQIREQVTPRFDGRYYALAQSGNEAVDKSGQMLWKEMLLETQVAAIEAFIEVLKNHFNITVKDADDIVENRGAQISYSVIGFHEDIDKKYAFDPDDSKRSAALKAYPEEIEKLRAVGVAVEPAGTTVFNFIPAGKHKGFNIARFIEREDWKSYDCVYVGDALFPGGNDATVIGVIPTHPVRDENDTFSFVTSNLVS